MNRNEKIIKEKLAHHEVTPSPKVWEGIASSMQRKTNPMFYLWFLALLIPLLIYGIYQINGEDEDLHYSADQIQTPPASAITDPEEDATFTADQEAVASDEGEISFFPKTTPEKRKAAGKSVTKSSDVKSPHENRGAESNVRNKESVKNLVKRIKKKEASGEAPGAGTISEEKEFLSPAEPVLTYLSAAKQLKPHFSFVKKANTLSNRKQTNLRLPENVTRRLWWEISAGPMMTIKDISYRSADYMDYANQREETESIRLGYQLKAGASYVGEDGLALRSGIIFSSFQEEFSPANAPVSLNSFNQLDIPLMVGFEMKSSKWRYAFNAGLIFNMFFDVNGQRFDPEGEIIDDEEIFRDNLGLSATSSIGFYYHLSPRVYLSAEPYIRFQLNPVTQDDYVLDQHHIYYGLSFGSRFKF